MRSLLLLFVSILIVSASHAIDDITQLTKAVKDAKPGDVLVLKNGVYRDAEIILVGNGEPGKPIIIKAETPGGVIISGASVLRIAGIAIELNGFHFTNGHSPKGAVWEFRNGNEVASHCRITNCAIENFDPPNRETEYSWILMYGRNNRLDHNSIIGKLNNGVTLAVILDEERNQQNHHVIENNYFGYRPNLGSNGGETIRVGTSQSSLKSSFTSIQNNYFEACDGEVEIVSIKSCDNIISNNTFYESAGVLALRHGHRNIVEGNAFIGNNKPYTGGIRVINEGHKIRNNYFYRLAGDRFFAALAVMNAVPNSLPNRYHQVKDVEITNNVWIDSENILFGVGKDNERTLAPANVTVSNNIFFNRKSNVVYRAFDKTDGFKFSNNKVTTLSGKFTQKGFVESRTLDPASFARIPVTKEETGASWYRLVWKPFKVLSGNTIGVRKGTNSLADAVDKASPGDIVELAEAGEYLIDRSLVLKHYLRIQASPHLSSRPVIRFNGTRGKVSMVTIADGGILEMQGIDFDGHALDGKASASSAIAPATVMKGHYSAYVNNCAFYNFTESSFSPFRSQKTTYADTLMFSNCLFRDMSGDAIYLAAEKDDAGKYSAEYVEVKNCAFYKVLGYAVDLYRGGSDESTTGPTIVVDHCVLEDVNNKERGSGMRLFGVQNVIVRNTSFSNTGRGGASIRFDENSWDKIAVTNCNVYNSGRIFSFWGKVVTGPVFNVKPTYRSAAKFDFRLAPSSPLNNKGTDKGPVGLTEKTNSNLLTKAK